MSPIRLAFPLLLGLAFSTTLTAGEREPSAAEAPTAADPRLTAESVIPAEAFRADLRMLRAAYESLHPGLYRSLTLAELDARFSALDRRAEGGITLRDAYLGLSELLGSIRCGHSYANYFNQSDEVAAALFHGVNRVPFLFRWIDRRMIVTRNLGDAGGLTPGAEILSINGVAAEVILDRLLPMARADGGNDAKRRASLEVRGDSTYEAFDVLASLAYPGWGPTFTLQVRDADDQPPRTIEAPALSHESRAALVEELSRKEKSGEPMWEWSRIDEKAALLRMPGWALYRTKWAWKTWLDQRMDELIDAKIPNLIIDLRGNEGGLDCGDVIVSRLIEQDLVLAGRQRYVCYTQTPPELDPHLNTWDDSFRDRRKDVIDAEPPALLAGNGRRFYRLAEEGPTNAAKIIQRSGRRYTGRVIVLVDAACSSATFQFALMVKQAKLATLVGEPTGGSQRGINGGSFFFMTLPSSKIEVDVPLVAAVPASGSAPDEGVAPDVLVPLKASDIRRGVDSQLEAALAITRGP